MFIFWSRLSGKRWEFKRQQSSLWNAITWPNVGRWDHSASMFSNGKLRWSQSWSRSTLTRLFVGPELSESLSRIEWHDWSFGCYIFIYIGETFGPRVVSAPHTGRSPWSGPSLRVPQCADSWLRCQGKAVWQYGGGVQLEGCYCRPWCGYRRQDVNGQLTAKRAEDSARKAWRLELRRWPGSPTTL